MKFEPDQNCEWVLERIDAFLDDELSGEDGARLETHIAECYSCKEELALASQVKQELRALPPKECPDRIVAAILEKIPSEPPEVREKTPRLRTIPWIKGGFRMAFIAAALVAVIWISIHKKPPVPGERISPAEVAEAERQIQITLAYVGYMSSRSAEMVRDDMESKIAPAVQDVFKKVLDTHTVPFKFFKSDES